MENSADHKKLIEVVKNSPKEFLLGSKDSSIRKLICNECEKKTQVLGADICSECNCILLFKTSLEFASCPLNKWAIPPKYQIK
jgi:hypothetical protein